jgi:hypothetical protein
VVRWAVVVSLPCGRPYRARIPSRDGGVLRCGLLAAASSRRLSAPLWHPPSGAPASPLMRASCGGSAPMLASCGGCALMRARLRRLQARERGGTDGRGRLPRGRARRRRWGIPGRLLVGQARSCVGGEDASWPARLHFFSKMGSTVGLTPISE